LKVLYFDCFAGAAGDMILGALLDAGLPFEELRRALGSLAVEGWDVSADRVIKAGITATKFKVHEHAHAHQQDPKTARPQDHGHHHHGQGHHSLSEICAAIERSALSVNGRARAVQMFKRLGEAESAIHGIPISQIHLHEVGALDSIIDIVGAVFAIEWFKADRILSSPINVGSGMARTEHGVFPVPAPATVALLKNAPVYSSGIQSELLTPTGALILTDLKETPNVVRVLIGEAEATQDPGPRTMKVVVLECEIDDMNPQIFGVLMEKLYAAGALEVFYSAVQMKKNRPGTLMTIVAKPAQREAMTDIVFRESTTIGIRHQELSRECLDREMVTVTTSLGAVRFKVARRDGRVLNAQPEFEDLAKLSAERGIPIKDVQALAHKAWLDRK